MKNKIKSDTETILKIFYFPFSSRLKTAFVKALQQEHEMEQKLAQTSPSPDPPTPKPIPKPVTPTRRVATPPTPVQALPLIQTPPTSKHQEHPLIKLTESGKFSPHHVATAAALQQQIMRGISTEISYTNILANYYSQNDIAVTII